MGSSWSVLESFRRELGCSGRFMRFQGFHEFSRKCQAGFRVFSWVKVSLPKRFNGFWRVLASILGGFKEFSGRTWTFQGALCISRDISAGLRG